GRPRRVLHRYPEQLLKRGVRVICCRLGRRSALSVALVALVSLSVLRDHVCGDSLCATDGQFHRDLDRYYSDLRPWRVDARRCHAQFLEWPRGNCNFLVASVPMVWAVACGRSCGSRCPIRNGHLTERWIHA